MLGQDLDYTLIYDAQVNGIDQGQTSKQITLNDLTIDDKNITTSKLFLNSYPVGLGQSASYQLRSNISPTGFGAFSINEPLALFDAGQEFTLDGNSINYFNYQVPVLLDITMLDIVDGSLGNEIYQGVSYPTGANNWNDLSDKWNAFKDFLYCKTPSQIIQYLNAGQVQVGSFEGEAIGTVNDFTWKSFVKVDESYTGVDIDDLVNSSTMVIHADDSHGGLEIDFVCKDDSKGDGTDRSFAIPTSIAPITGYAIPDKEPSEVDEFYLKNNLIKYNDSVDDPTKIYCYSVNMTQSQFNTSLHNISFITQDDERGILKTNFNIDSVVLQHTISGGFTPTPEDLMAETDDFNKTIEL
ncbi:hypothetical protein Barb4_01275 [Bacteroidales bacterium Barb4]|nr:hypothetical protein Barb4_01275 [Bacteroidales bacterium Barb4]